LGTTRKTNGEHESAKDGIRSNDQRNLNRGGGDFAKKVFNMNKIFLGGKKFQLRNSIL